MVLKRAILIGINYVNTKYTLSGCVNDVKNVFNYICSAFPSCTQFFILTDEAVSLKAPSSKYNIVYAKSSAKDISSFMYVSMFGLNRGDSILIHYSGHGGRIVDKNGDEPSGFDSCIYPCANGQVERIIDDDLRNIIADRVPPGITCFTLFDCCYSGSALDLRYQYRPVQQGGLPSGGNKPYIRVASIQNTKYQNTRGNIIYFSACLESQQAAEYYSIANKAPTGAMTEALLSTMRKYGGKIHPTALLLDTANSLKAKGFTQIPQFDTGMPIDMNKSFSL